MSPPEPLTSDSTPATQVGRGSQTPPTPDLRSPVSARSETFAEQATCAERTPHSKGPPELFQIVVECRDEAEQRTLFERLRAEGLKLRLLVL
jgi:hypothetical protein